MSAIFHQLSQVDLLALCMWGEARGEPVQGKIAVGCVVRNRTVEKKITYHSVILSKKQFSCFNQEDPNREKMLEIAGTLTGAHGEILFKEYDVFSEIWFLAKGILGKIILDNTRGANHYYNPSVCSPKWAEKMIKTVEIGSHVFLKG